MTELTTKLYKCVNGTGEFNAGGGEKPCDGLVSHPGESRNTPSHLGKSG